MESQLHQSHGPHSYESLHPAVKGTDVHDEYEHGGETKSAMKKVKAKVEKLKATIKHGPGHGHNDDAETVNDSPPVRSGLVEPTVMGTPVLAEDLYATHSDIVDPPVRSFAQWEEEEKDGAPPPLSTEYGTHLTDMSHFGVNREQLRGNIGKTTGKEEDPRPHNPTTAVSASNHQTKVIGKSTGMEEDSSAPKLTTAFSPANYQTKVTDPTNAGGKEAGITDVLRTFDKMKVYDEPKPDSKSSEFDENEPNVYTGSHDQFAPEPVRNLPLDTAAGDPSDQNSSYTEKITSATTAIASKAAAAKDMIVSKLGSSSENKSKTKSSLATDYSHKVADALSGTLGPVYEKVVGAGKTTESPMTESKGVIVKEYLVDTFKPGDDDKVLSEMITNVFHRGEGNEPPQETTTTTTAYVIEEEAERRLQDSAN